MGELEPLVAELRDALKPFAELCERNDNPNTYIWPDDRDHWVANTQSWGLRVNVGMIRKAAEAYAKAEEALRIE